MQKTFLIHLTCALLCVLPAGGTFAGETRALVNYQGKLIKGTNLLNDTVSMTFRVFTGATNSECVYEETMPVTLRDGLYSAAIGENPINGDLEEAVKLDEAYLEVSIEGVTMKPRERFTPPAFAKKSTEKWRLFGAYYCSHGPPWVPSVYAALQEASTMDAVYLLIRAETNELSALDHQGFVFPPAGERLTIASVKFFLTPFMLRQSASVHFHLEALTATRTGEGICRDLSPWFSIPCTNVASCVWMDIPVKANGAQPVLAPSEMLYIRCVATGPEWQGMQVFPSANILWEVRVK